MDSVTLEVRTTVYDAQGLGSLYCGGLPGVPGVWGGTHALLRKISERLPDYNVLLGEERFAFALDLRTIIFRVSHPKFSPYHEKFQAGANAASASTVDTRSLDFDLSWIIQIPCGRVLGEWERREVCKVVEDLVHSLRFCGGTIDPQAKVMLRTSLASAFRQIPNSFAFVADAHEDLEDILDHEIRCIEDGSTSLFQAKPDALDVLLLLITKGRKDLKRSIAKAKNKEEHIISRIVSNYFVPVSVGYACIEHPKSRALSRASTHAYGESVIGLGKMIMASHARKATEDELYQYMWCMNEETVDDYPFFYFKSCSKA